MAIGASIKYENGAGRSQPLKGEFCSLDVRQGPQEIHTALLPGEMRLFPCVQKNQALWQRHVCMQLHVISNFTAKEIFKMLNSIQLNGLQAEPMPAISSEMQKTMGSLAGWGTDRCRMRQKQVQWNADLGDGVCGKRLHHLKFVPNNYYGKGTFEIKWC